MVPFADFLSLTTSPESAPDVVAGVLPVLEAAGGHYEANDEHRAILRVADGTVLLQKRFGVFQCSASGDAIRALRSTSLWGEYLAAFVAIPHRVTRLDSTLELDVDAPNVIRSVWRQASRGRIALTHKRVPAANCSKHIAVGLDGRETGTVYVGTPQAEVRAVVYDKRQEIFVRTGADVGPRLRYEIRCKSGIGACLADAHSPTALFWHYAAPGLIDRPEGVQAWKPHGEGFEMPERVEFTPYQLMDRKLEASPDVRRLLELAESMGPLGIDFLCQKLRRMAAWSGDAPQGRPEGAEAVLGRPTPHH